MFKEGREPSTAACSYWSAMTVLIVYYKYGPVRVALPV